MTEEEILYELNKSDDDTTYKVYTAQDLADLFEYIGKNHKKISEKTDFFKS